MEHKKKCTRCKNLKPLTEFGWRNKKEKKYAYECNECRILTRREWYARHREEQNERARLRNLKYKYRNKAYLYDYLLKHPCVDCKESDVVVLDFDHVRGEKEINLGSTTSGWRLERVIREVEKCAVRCANCHRRKTSQERQTYRYRRSRGLMDKAPVS